MISLSWDIHPTLEFYAFDIGEDQMGMFVPVFKFTYTHDDDNDVPAAAIPSAYGIFCPTFTRGNSHLLEHYKKNLRNIYIHNIGMIRRVFNEFKTGEDYEADLRAMNRVLGDKEFTSPTTSDYGYSFAWTHLEDDYFNTRKV